MRMCGDKRANGEYQVIVILKDISFVRGRGVIERNN